MGYDEVLDGYIIFICKHDSLECGFPVYTIDPSCKENAEVEAGSGVADCLNTFARKVESDERVNALLGYVHNGPLKKLVALSRT